MQYLKRKVQSVRNNVLQVHDFTSFHCSGCRRSSVQLLANYVFFLTEITHTPWKLLPQVLHEHYGILAGVRAARWFATRPPAENAWSARVDVAITCTTCAMPQWTGGEMLLPLVPTNPMVPCTEAAVSGQNNAATTLWFP